MTTGWPSRCDNFCPSTRPITSAVLAGGNGAISRIGLVGQASCACAGAMIDATAANASTSRVIVWPLIVSLVRSSVTVNASGLRIDLERLAHAGMHVVGAGQHGQLDNLSLVEMAAQRLEHVVRDVHVTGRGVNKSEHRALACIEERARAPVGERVALGLREPLGQRQER